MSSTDWQSLTFSGERHRLALRIVGADSREIAERLSAGLEDAELNVPGAIVADIALVGDLKTNDAATELLVEALTIVDD